MPRPHTHTRRIWCWHFLSHMVAAWASVVLLLYTTNFESSNQIAEVLQNISYFELNWIEKTSLTGCPKGVCLCKPLRAESAYTLSRYECYSHLRFADCMLYWGSVGASSHQKLTGSVWMTLFDLGTSLPRTWLYHFEDNAMSKDNTWKIAKWKVHFSWQLSRNQLQYYKKQV